jgi:hypothetical protein
MGRFIPLVDPSGRPPGQDGAVAFLQRSVSWCFRDRRTGRVVVGQAPNPPILAFVALEGVRRLAQPSGRAEDVLRWGGTAALAWWSVDEVVRGVNPWRRLLGVLGLVLVARRLR